MIVTQRVLEGASGDGSGDGVQHIVEVVHSQLRAAIINGSLTPGKVISQVQLAAQLGVSRTPLREALRLLEREGFVDAEHNKRIRIAAFSVTDLEQVYAMRIALECLALQLSVPRLRSSDQRALEKNLRDMDDAATHEDYDRWNTPHRQFHAGLLVGTGNRLRQTIEDLSDHAERYRYSTTTMIPRAWDTGAQEHREILQSAMSRDSARTGELLARHYARVALNAITLIAPEHDPSQIRAALRAATLEDRAAWS